MTCIYMHLYSLKVRNYVQLKMETYYPSIVGLGAVYGHLIFLTLFVSVHCRSRMHFRILYI